MAESWITSHFDALAAYLAGLDDPGAKMALLMLQDLRSSIKSGMDPTLWNAVAATD